MKPATRHIDLAAGAFAQNGDASPHALAGARVLQVSAGTGPVEVRRFVALLAEHLAARCEALGAIVGDVVVHGDEATPWSVEIHLPASNAAIEALAGTHTLVARSPDRGKKARKRWFASVALCAAESAPADAPAVSRDDVIITATRAGGPGGQHVNKTSSAVRVFHKASGVTVRVADERSQRDNVRAALARIAAIVAQRAREKTAGARAERRLLHYRLTRGQAAFVYELDRNGGLLSCEETCSR